MTPERRKKIEDIFHAAASLPKGEQEAYLKQTCSDDPDLLREVEQLLSEDGAVEESLESVIGQVSKTLISAFYKVWMGRIR